jgi:hypothetical protein
MDIELEQIRVLILKIRKECQKDLLTKVLKLW